MKFIRKLLGIGPTQAEMDAWVRNVEEIKCRDYRLIPVHEFVNDRGQTVTMRRLVHVATGEPWKCPEF